MAKPVSPGNSVNEIKTGVFNLLMHLIVHRQKIVIHLNMHWISLPGVYVRHSLTKIVALATFQSKIKASFLVIKSTSIVCTYLGSSNRMQSVQRNITRTRHVQIY